MRKVIAFFAFALVGVSYADWLYDSSTKTLTECDSAGTPIAEGAWVFSTTAKISEDGNEIKLTIAKKTIGTSSILDFQAPIHGAAGVSIIELANDFFFDNAETKALLTEVKLPLTLISIGKRAFYEHTNLVSVTPFLPSGVKSIGLQAFYYAAVTNALRFGYIDENQTCSVAYEAFYGTPIPSVDIGPGVTLLEKKTFQNCRSLKTVKLPNTLKKMEYQLFGYCKAIESIEPFFPDSVTSIGADLFTEGGYAITNHLRIGHGGATTLSSDFQGTAIPSVDIGPGVTSLPNDCFQDCKSLKTVKLPDTLTSIGSQAFYGCAALEHVKPFLPASVKSIGTQAFYTDAAITDKLYLCQLKDTVCTIGSQAFMDCSQIPAITFGPGTPSFNKNSLRGTYGAREIRFLCDRPSIYSSAFWRNSKTAANKLSTIVYLPKNLPRWSEFIAASVTPWNEVSDTDKATYYANFGEDAAPPDGMIVETNSSMGTMLNQWYVGISTVQGLTIFVR